MAEETATATAERSVLEGTEKAVEKTSEEKLFDGKAQGAETTATVKTDASKSTSTADKTASTKSETTATSTETAKTDSATKTTTEEAKTAPLEYDLALPQGSLLTADELAATKAEAIKEGLTKEEAEGVIQIKDEAVKSYAARQADLVKQLPKMLAEQCPKDPVLSIGDYKANIELAHRGFEDHADSDMKKWLKETGFDNHPLVVRHFWRLGKANAEDTFHRGSTGASPAQKTPESRLYGKTTPGANGKTDTDE